MEEVFIKLFKFYLTFIKIFNIMLVFDETLRIVTEIGKSLSSVSVCYIKTFFPLIFILLTIVQRDIGYNRFII